MTTCDGCALRAFGLAFVAFFAGLFAAGLGREG
jgi:hypothetical protein